MLAICELLVIKGLCKTIYLTRLPTGHTHEDIDAVFGQIWLHVRDKNVLTPQAYRDIIQTSLKKGDEAPEVLDVYVIPDFVRYMSDLVDQNFKNYSKLDKTKHQFQFFSVPRTPATPHGAKTCYKTYASDAVMEIQESKASEENEADGFHLGFKAIRLLCPVHPKPDEPPMRLVRGDFNNNYRLPTNREFHPVPFVPGHRENVRDKTLVIINGANSWCVVQKGGGCRNDTCPCHSSDRGAVATSS